MSEVYYIKYLTSNKIFLNEHNAYFFMKKKTERFNEIVLMSYQNPEIN